MTSVASPERMTRYSMTSREHTPGSSILAVLIALLLVMTGLSGCFGTDENPLREDLKVDMERSFATDHIWTPDGPRTPFNEDVVYILLYLTLQNRGDSDLHIFDMSFWLHSSETSNFWSPVLMTMFRVALEEDPRFTEGSLETFDIILPPGDSVAGWTLFDPSNAFMEEDVLELRATHGNSDDPLFRIDVPVDGMEVDWGVPSMLAVEPAELRYTNFCVGDRVEYGERFFVANLRLMNKWPVPARLDPDGITMTDSNGNVLEPVRVGSVDPTDGSYIQVGGTGFLEITFLVGPDAIPSSINLVEDPPIVLDMDPALIVTDFVPSRIDVTPNFMYYTEENYIGTVLVFNFTLYNPRVVDIPVGPENFKLLDGEGTIHDSQSRGINDGDLDSFYMMPRSNITSRVAFKIPGEVVPVTLAHDDGGRFTEFDLAEIPLLTPDILPRLSFEVISLNMTTYGASGPWNEWFYVRLGVQNLLPFEVHFSSYDLVLFDTDGRQYWGGFYPPPERGELGSRSFLGPSEHLSGGMAFRVEGDATPERLVYDHEGDVQTIDIDPDKIVADPPETPTLALTLNEALYTHRIDDEPAENGSRFLIINLTIENIGNESQHLKKYDLRLWDSNRSTQWQDQACQNFRSYFFVYDLPPEGSCTTLIVFTLEDGITPMYLSIDGDRSYYVPLFDLEIATVEIYPRLNVTVTSIEYVDQVGSFRAPTGYRYLVMNVTVSSRWLEPLRLGSGDFSLLNETGERERTVNLPGSLEKVDLSRDGVVSGVVYFLVPLGYDPQDLVVFQYGDDPSIPIDPGPA